MVNHEAPRPGHSKDGISPSGADINRSLVSWSAVPTEALFSPVPGMQIARESRLRESGKRIPGIATGEIITLSLGGQELSIDAIDPGKTTVFGGGPFVTVRHIPRGRTVDLAATRTLMDQAREGTRRLVRLQPTAMTAILRVGTDSPDVWDMLLELGDREGSSKRRDWWGNHNFGEDTSAHPEGSRFFVTTIIGSAFPE